jgi:hypothetical protein
MDEEYHIKPIKFWTGEDQITGYAPMVVDPKDRIVAFALAGGLQSGNDQPHHPTPEEALVAYEEAPPYQPVAANGRPVPNNEPYSHLLRALYPPPVNLEAAGAAEE